MNVQPTLGQVLQSTCENGLRGKERRHRRGNMSKKDNEVERKEECGLGENVGPILRAREGSCGEKFLSFCGIY